MVWKYSQLSFLVLVLKEKGRGGGGGGQGLSQTAPLCKSRSAVEIVP